MDTMGERRRDATQSSFLICYLNDFSACWHVAAMYPCPHVGPFLWGPCSAEHAEIRLCVSDHKFLADSLRL